jgi:hypothetical protein
MGTGHDNHERHTQRHVRRRRTGLSRTDAATISRKIRWRQSCPLAEDGQQRQFARSSIGVSPASRHKDPLTLGRCGSISIE